MSAASASTAVTKSASHSDSGDKGEASSSSSKDEKKKGKFVFGFKKSADGKPRAGKGTKQPKKHEKPEVLLKAIPNSACTWVAQINKCNRLSKDGKVAYNNVLGHIFTDLLRSAAEYSKQALRKKTINYNDVHESANKWPHLRPYLLPNTNYQRDEEEVETHKKLKVAISKRRKKRPSGGVSSKNK